MQALTASLSEDLPGADDSNAVPPPTLIRLIQEIDHDIQIPDEQLTMDKPMANPKEDNPTGGDD